ncbi:MAG: heme exporter protein CcmD [Betaproteobacteria bacterium]|nr:heme exporter protein CcmD [Betaproteobacteria bacterium]
MSWGSWGDFFAMGGYALYVWGSYAVTLGLMVAEVVLLVLRKRNILEHLGRMRGAARRVAL